MGVLNIFLITATLVKLQLKNKLIDMPYSL